MQNVCIGSTCNCSIIQIDVISRSTVTIVPTGKWGINKLHMAVNVNYVLPSSAMIIRTRCSTGCTRRAVSSKCNVSIVCLCMEPVISITTLCRCKGFRSAGSWSDTDSFRYAPTVWLNTNSNFKGGTNNGGRSKWEKVLIRSERIVQLEQGDLEAYKYAIMANFRLKRFEDAQNLCNLILDLTGSGNNTYSKYAKEMLEVLSGK